MTNSTGLTPQTQRRLAEAERRGYLIATPRERIFRGRNLSNPWWRACRRRREPCAAVVVGRRYCRGWIDYETTLRLDPNPRVGSITDELPPAGAAAIEAFWRSYAAPHGRLTCCLPGSCNVSVDGIPADLAADLGALLAQAATAYPVLWVIDLTDERPAA